MPKAVLCLLLLLWVCLAALNLANKNTGAWDPITLASPPEKRYAAAYSNQLHGMQKLWHIHGGKTKSMGPGGISNETLIFDARKKVFVSSVVTGDLPPTLELHTLTYATIGEAPVVVLVGGLINDMAKGGSENKMALNCQVYILNLKTLAWKKLSVSMPKPRFAHTAVFYNNKIYVSGGYSNHSAQPFADMWSFDLTTSVWSELKPSGVGANANIARAGHASIVVEDKLYIFGGVSANFAFLNDTLVYDFEKNAVAPLKVIPGDDGFPSSRAFGCYTVYNENLWYYGGTNSKEVYDELWVLSLVEGDVEWSKTIIVSKQKPIARAGCAIVADSNGAFLFGGATLGSAEVLQDAWAFTVLQ